LLNQKKKQILAQQPGGVRAFPFGISRQICFFSEVGLSDQCPQPSFTYGKNSMHYPGIEPSTFGVEVGDANHYAIQAATFVKSTNVYFECI
jgi:hypothetical protein